ncbi:MAG: hypothetical protein IPG96_11390 [Proteobacteria bacterium]|nr:hypothetical protein [Pseudomonadota bacterium]
MIELYGERYFHGEWPGARGRFMARYVGDHEPTRWLPEKILADGSLLSWLQHEVRSSGLLPQLHVYRMTEAEAELAVALGAPAVALAPELQNLGTKSGSRDLARLAIQGDERYGGHLLPGREHLRSRAKVADAIFALYRDHGVRAAMIKANEGSSGEGQVGAALSPALLDALSRLSERDGRALVRRWVRKGLVGTTLNFRHPSMSWPKLMAMIESMGGVVEAFIPEVLEAQAQGQVVPQASVQFLADGLGPPRIIGSADVIEHGDLELLAGPSAHAALDGLHDFAEGLLRAAGPKLLGPGSFDFTGSARPVFTEVNTRQTAVTAPAMGVATPLAQAQYDRATGRLLDPTGRSWHWVAAGSVPLPKGGGGRPSDRAWHDPWWRPAFDTGRFEDGAFVLPTRMDQPGRVGLVAVAPETRAAALRAFDNALGQLGSLY